LKVQGEDWRMDLEWILGWLGGVSIGFYWLRIGTSGEVL
jgi:hypothetical protein